MSYSRWFIDSLKLYWILKLLSIDDDCKTVPSHADKKTLKILLRIFYLLKILLFRVYKDWYWEEGTLYYLLKETEKTGMKKQDLETVFFQYRKGLVET